MLRGEHRSIRLTFPTGIVREREIIAHPLRPTDTQNGHTTVTEIFIADLKCRTPGPPCSVQPRTMEIMLPTGPPPIPKVHHLPVKGTTAEDMATRAVHPSPQDSAAARQRAGSGLWRMPCAAGLRSMSRCLRGMCEGGRVEPEEVSLKGHAGQGRR